MIHFFKQNPILKLMLFFLITIIACITYSCCKETDCKCNPNCDEPEKKVEYWKYFIAHAGGQIDGIDYTNCVEALDLSYSKGCRLFELDLRVTTDGKIIAAHDPIEITEAEFMSTLIEGKYTPMNMETINDWFRRHPDAILVTDKINSPQRIYDEFLFPDRVVMELFTWGAIDKAIELGIKPMASEWLIFAKSTKALSMNFGPVKLIPDEELEQIFKEKGIEYICMSRWRISGREDFLRRLKKNGIKNYVYSLEYPINGQPAEQYVWNYEMNFCYGMYANDLDLLASLLNEK